MNFKIIFPTFLLLILTKNSFSQTSLISCADKKTKAIGVSGRVFVKDYTGQTETDIVARIIILYEQNKDDIPIKAIAEVKKAIEDIKKAKPNIKWKSAVVGHTNSDPIAGDPDGNITLSKKRAEAAKTVLAKTIIEAKDYDTVGKGSTTLVDSCFNILAISDAKSKEDKVTSRRAEVVLRSDTITLEKSTELTIAFAPWNDKMFDDPLLKVWNEEIFEAFFTETLAFHFSEVEIVGYAGAVDDKCPGATAIAKRACSWKAECVTGKTVNQQLQLEGEAPPDPYATFQKTGPAGYPGNDKESRCLDVVKIPGSQTSYKMKAGATAGSAPTADYSTSSSFEVRTELINRNEISRLRAEAVSTYLKNRGYKVNLVEGRGTREKNALIVKVKVVK